MQIRTRWSQQPRRLLQHALACIATLTMAGPLAANPLAAGSTNPLAAADPFQGEFTGDTLSASVRKTADGYAGTLSLEGRSYDFEARASGSSLSGSFRAGEDSFPFAAELKDDGGTLEVETGGAQYALTRAGNQGSAAATAALASPKPSTAPNKSKGPSLFGGAKTSGKEENDMLAKGSTASLSRDAAVAYVEALHFSLYQVGENGMVAELPQATVIEALANEFPSFDPETQRELANARAIWTETLDGWASSSPEDQLEFVTEMLGLAGFDTSGLYAAQPGASGAGATNGASNSGASYAPYLSFNQTADEIERESYINSGATDAGDGTYEVYDASSDSYTYE